jgi:hypothetical protein
VAYPDDWLNAPELVFETVMMVQTNSMAAELTEIEKRVELVYPVFAAPFLFAPAFQVQVPVPDVLLFQPSPSHLVLVP